NHAQGVALPSRKLGIKAVIVMPQTTPDLKEKSVKAHGARVVLRGDALDEPASHAQQLVAKHGYTYIPPYDDPDVIAGQGGVVLALLASGLWRSRSDRRPGRRGHGDDVAVHPAAARGVRSGRRWGPDRRHGGLDQIAAPRVQGNRR